MLADAFSPDKHVITDRERQKMKDDFTDLDKKIKNHEQNTVVLQAMNSISEENNSTYKKQVEFMKKYLSPEQLEEFEAEFKDQAIKTFEEEVQKKVKEYEEEIEKTLIFIEANPQSEINNTKSGLLDGDGIQNEDQSKFLDENEAEKEEMGEEEEEGKKNQDEEEPNKEGEE